jgi:hypothetical protein
MVLEHAQLNFHNLITAGPPLSLSLSQIQPGRTFKRWRKRWVVLQDSMLYSFKKQGDYTNPTEVIDLTVFSSVKSTEDYTNRANSFDVYSSTMGFSLVAATENDKEDWIRAIGRAIVITRTNTWQDEDSE